MGKLVMNQKIVENYLKKWEELEDYKYARQEEAIERVFADYRLNDNLANVLIKVAVLNDFYSTNIFSVFKVAKHINGLKIDEKLKSGDENLVDTIANVKTLGKRFYSFATKYCSHHNQKAFPIYDGFVSKALMAFKKQDKFSSKFESRKSLEDYKLFKEILEDFKKYYNLSCDFKELDKCLWQIGRKL